MTDNRTTELREKLNKLIIELDRLDITLDSPVSDMTLGEYEQEREKLLDGFIQAIAATLGNEHVTGGTLTAEQVSKAVYTHSIHADCADADWQAIADELNARAERTCRNVREEWAKTSFAHAETSFCCSECGAHYVDCEAYYAGLADADGEQIRTNYCPNCGAKVVE